MVKEIQIYIEGGAKGQDRASSVELRKGFSTFFGELVEKAREKNIRFKLIICGSTEITCKIFSQANEKSSNEFLVLLVDSDLPVSEDETPKSFLQNQEKLKKCDLRKVNENQCHLMVQVMESWFLADIDALKKHFGQDFKENKLRKNKKVEEIAKDDVLNSLKESTKDRKKGSYHKIQDGAKLLEIINSNRVREVAPNCERLFRAILEKI